MLSLQEEYVLDLAVQFCEDKEEEYRELEGSQSLDIPVFFMNLCELVLVPHQVNDQNRRAIIAAAREMCAEAFESYEWCVDPNNEPQEMEETYRLFVVLYEALAALDGQPPKGSFESEAEFAMRIGNVEAFVIA